MSEETQNAGTELTFQPQGGKRISLVLSSGGARGLAHIGVIRELVARGYEIETISGSSMGALVGGLYACGKMEAFADWALQLEPAAIVRMVDVTTAPGGVIAGARVMEKLAEWIGEQTIENLPIEYTAVAVDIEREREFWMSDGSLYHAVRASIAIPGVFTPHAYRGRKLVDGGVLNPLPIAPTLSRPTDQTFVVDVNGPPTALTPWRNAGEFQTKRDRSWLSRALGKVGFGASEPSVLERKLGGVTVLLTAVDMTQAALTRQQLAVFNPTRVFHIPRNISLIYEFHRAEELIAAGRAIASELLDTIVEKEAQPD